MIFQFCLIFPSFFLFFRSLWPPSLLIIGIPIPEQQLCGQYTMVRHGKYNGICCANCLLATQNLAPTLPGFQGIKRCVIYLDIHTHKPIFYPSNSYYGPNVIRLTCSGNQVEEYTTHNCLECYQYADHAIIINRRRSVSGILHTLIGVANMDTLIQPPITTNAPR